MNHSSNLLWVQSAWLEQVRQWIEAELHRHAIHRVGAIAQPHIRPWSTVLRIPTDAGDIYFKAVIPDLAYEAALTQVLFDWYPQDVPYVLATEQTRGWLLMADGGVRLRECLRTTDDIQHWESLLPKYAVLQQNAVQHVDEVLEMGVCDRRLSVLPTRFQDLLANEEAIGLNRPAGLNSDDYRQLQDSVDTVVNLCAKLAALGIPETLHHGDLHDGNVFILNGHYRFFDWGDSSISHPFFSLHSVYGSLRRRFSLEANSTYCKRLKACYLKAWTQTASGEQVELAFNLAQQLAAIPAILRWLPVLSSMDALTRNQYANAIPELLRELLRAV